MISMFLENNFFVVGGVIISKILKVLDASNYNTFMAPDYISSKISYA